MVYKLQVCVCFVLFIYSLFQSLSHSYKIKENCFTLFKKKPRSRQYPAETITDADYADDLVLLANTLAQAESLLYSLEQAASHWSLCELG